MEMGAQKFRIRNNLKDKAKQIEESQEQYINSLSSYGTDKSSHFHQVAGAGSKISSPYPLELMSEKSSISGIGKIN